MKKYKVTSEHPFLKSGLILKGKHLFKIECYSTLFFNYEIKQWKKKGWVKKVNKKSFPEVEVKDGEFDPKIFIDKPKFKADCYYKTTDSVVYIKSHNEWFGLSNGEWYRNEDLTCNIEGKEIMLIKGVQECSKEHYYNKLLKYAKKKYKKGSLVKWVSWSEPKQIGELYIDIEDSTILSVNSDENFIIYENNNWIPIVG